MRNYIYKLFVFLFILLITFTIVEILLRQIPNDYKSKREYLESYSDKIEILFLGGSYSQAGLNPIYTKKRSYNAALVSQSLDCDLEILRKYESKWSSLEYIVLPISYVSFFNKIEADSLESWRVKNYNMYSKIMLSKRLRYHTEILNGLLLDNIIRLYNYHIKNIDNIKCTELGWGVSSYSAPHEVLLDSGRESAKRNTVVDLDLYYDEMTSTLDLIIDFSKEIDCYLILYTSPACKSYIENLNTIQMDRTIKTIQGLIEGNDNCFYINLLNNSSFSDKDFRDGDHLNGRGAEKLTLKIDSIINNLSVDNELFILADSLVI